MDKDSQHLSNKQKVISELIRLYGDIINTRGIIIDPNQSNSGKVHFNILDKNHPDFGRKSYDYLIDKNGNIFFS